MILLSAIIKTFEKAFLEKYRKVLLPSYKNALAAMKHCRSDQGLHMLAACSASDCSGQRYIPHSCGHRSCPHCQNHENWQWIENQLRKKVPARYYLLTFTLPEQLREIAWQNQKAIYSLMFACVQDLLKTFTRNDKTLQGTPGFTTVLHTKARNLDFHPHIHVLMPGASINTETGLWRVKSSKYLFSHKNLAQVFRAKLLEAMVSQGLKVPQTTPRDWVVDCKAVGNGDKAIIYLGKYLYKGVIEEKDILRCVDGNVTFRYLHARTKAYKTKTVSGEYFLYLLMLHVLPKGFQRTRCYGFLHPCCKKLITFLQCVLRVSLKFQTQQKKPRPDISCPVCGAPMKIVMTRIYKPPLGLSSASL